MQYVTMPKSRKTHESCRHDICLLCFKKVKCSRRRIVTSEEYRVINTFLIEGVSPEDHRLPCVLCTTCRLIINEYDRGVFDRSINLFDFSKKFNFSSTSERRSRCNCTICQISCSQFGSLSLKEGKHCTKDSEGKICPIKLCNICLSEIAQGKSHVCSSKTLENNILSRITSSVSEHIASKVIKECSATTSDGYVQLSQTHGKPLSVRIAPSYTPRQHTFTLKDLADIKSCLRLSQRQTICLSNKLRIASNNRNIVESYLKPVLIDTNHQLDEFFTVKDNIVHCNDIASLIEYIEAQRKFSQFICYKIGLDSGCGSIKVTLNIFENFTNTDIQKSKRAKYSEGIFPQYKSDTGVHKLMILALAHDTTETYEHVKALLDAIDVPSLPESRAGERPLRLRPQGGQPTAGPHVVRVLSPVLLVRRP